MNRCVCEREIHFGVGNKWYHGDSSESCINYAPPPTAPPASESILDPKLKALHEEPPYYNAKVLRLDGGTTMLFEETVGGDVILTVRHSTGSVLIQQPFSKAQWKALQSIVYQL